MQTSQPDRTALRAEPQDSRLWALLALMVAGLLAAFWFVCQQQVRSAETRHATSRVQRVAMDDCLRRVRGATPISCAERMDPAGLAQTGYATR